VNGKTTVVLVITALTAFAQAAQPGFDPKDVVRRVRQDGHRDDIPQSALRMPLSVDVSRLAPRVYFVSSRPSAAGRQPSAIRKVIVTK
jgi:hypothetical protein